MTWHAAMPFRRDVMRVGHVCFLLRTYCNSKKNITFAAIYNI